MKYKHIGNLVSSPRRHNNTSAGIKVKDDGSFYTLVDGIIIQDGIINGAGKLVESIITNKPKESYNL